MWSDSLLCLLWCFGIKVGGFFHFSFANTDLLYESALRDSCVSATKSFVEISSSDISSSMVWLCVCVCMRVCVYACVLRVCVCICVCVCVNTLLPYMALSGDTTFSWGEGKKKVVCKR